MYFVYLSIQYPEIFSNDVAGYTLRQIHQSNVEKKLESLEQAVSFYVLSLI